MRPTELHIFDFDGTLFNSPTPPPSYGKRGWWDDLRSLEPPCVPEKPSGSWFNGAVVSAFRKAKANPKAVTVVMTGRLHYFRSRLKVILASGGIKPDELLLKQPGGGATEAYKVAAMRYLLKQMPQTKVIEFWEDRHNHLKNFELAAARLGYTLIPHPVRAKERPAACDIKPIASRVATQWTEKNLIIRVADSHREAMEKYALRQRSLQKMMGVGGTFGVLSAYSTGSKSENKARQGALVADLQRMGYRKWTDLKGSWEGVTEKSILVPRMKPTDLFNLGRKYTQDAVIYKSKDGVIGMYYTKGKPRAEIAVNPKGDAAFEMASDESLFSKARGLSFEFGFLWGQDVPWDGRQPISRKKMRGLVQHELKFD
jgi:hypothetical protein